MNEIIIENIGKLQFKDDHWECWEIPTKIGTVDLQVDSVSIDPSTLPVKIQEIFNQINFIDAKAREYLTQNVPTEEFCNFGRLIEPSILLSDENYEGHFTLFYNCSNDDDIICGVDFRNYEPFDLTIGD